jgi:preprotein translocase subunit SecG
MENVLLVVQLLIAVAMVMVILLQRTAQDGGGLMGGGSTMGGLFTARGSANLLTRTTAILATLFILNSLALGYIASRDHQSRSAIDQIPATAPASETTPLAAPMDKSPQPDMKTPEEPKAPEAPQVPVAQ